MYKNKCGVLIVISKGFEDRKINILIVEDNFDEMEYCTRLINEVDVEKVLYRTGNSKDALKIVAQNNIDVAFIDVVLPDENGFRLAATILNMMDYRFLKIIFITGKRVDQLRVFKTLHCYDYIMKPFLREEFLKTAKPLLQSLFVQKGSNMPTKKEKQVYVEVDNEAMLLKYSNICFAETSGRRMRLVTKDGAFEGIRMTVNDFVRDMDSEMFQKCHMSYAVNIKNIIKIRKHSSRLWDIYFSDEIFCPLSKTHYDAISAAFRSNK